MSEIDFAEIEKAMAELVNKAQGKERQQGLGQVAKERSQIAKKVETAHEQGDIATKRIIVASNAIRTNPRSVHSAPRVTSPIMPPTPGRVMDFVVPSPTPPPVPQEQEAPAADPELQKTVGDLSNEYLTEQVRDTESYSDSDFASAEDIKEEIDEQLGSVQPDAWPEQKEPIEESVATLEDLTGPAPIMSSSQEPTMHDAGLSIGTSKEEPRDELDSESQLPEADDLAEEVGKVHKIYGQKLPKEYMKKQDKDFRPKTKVKSVRKKRGFAFFFVLVMILASITVWGAAAYLYFAA